MLVHQTAQASHKTPIVGSTTSTGADTNLTCVPYTLKKQWYGNTSKQEKSDFANMFMPLVYSRYVKSHCDENSIVDPNSRVAWKAGDEARDLLHLDNYPATPENQACYKYLWSADPLDVVDIARARNPHAKIVLVNVANDKEPGDMLFTGKSSLEASLCLRTTLFATLARRSDLPELRKPADKRSQSYSSSIYPIGPRELVISENVKIICSRVGKVPRTLADNRTIDVFSCTVKKQPKTKDDGKDYHDEADADMIARKLKDIMDQAVYEHEVDEAARGVSIVLVPLGCGLIDAHPAPAVAKLFRRVLEQEQWELNGVVAVHIACRAGLKHYGPLWRAFTQEFRNANQVSIDDTGARRVQEVLYGG